MSDLNSKILKQVEFYFSDSNFPRDKFLRAQAALNEEGYVPIATLSTFNRMKELTTDSKVVAAALKTSKVVEVNADGTMLKRKNPLPETDDSNQRTIYAKGLATQGVSIEELANLFSKYGTVLSVRIRKDKAKNPKDSAFIEFSSPEEASAAVKEPPKFKDAQLTAMMRLDYVQKKKDERKNKRKADDDDEDNEDTKSEEKPAKKKKIVKENKHKEGEFTKGVVIGLKNVGGGINRMVLKDIFGKFGKVNFVDFPQDSSEGFVRMDDPEDVKKAIEDFKTNNTKIGGNVPELTILEGDAENAYWEKILSSKKTDNNKKRGGKRRKRF